MLIGALLLIVRPLLRLNVRAGLDIAALLERLRLLGVRPLLERLRLSIALLERLALRRAALLDALRLSIAVLLEGLLLKRFLLVIRSQGGPHLAIGFERHFAELPIAAELNRNLGLLGLLGRIFQLLRIVHVLSVPGDDDVVGTNARIMSRRLRLHLPDDRRLVAIVDSKGSFRIEKGEKF